MPNHILRDQNIMINLPIIHLEFQPDEIRQDGCASGLRFDRGGFLAGRRADDVETVEGERERGWR
jgi:hypothetical protein